MKTNFIFSDFVKNIEPQKIYRKTALLLLSVAMSVFSLTAQVDSRNLIFSTFDKPAKFKGKPSKTDKFVSKHMIYPDDAWRMGIVGVVVVEGVVTKDGQLMELSVKESVDPLLDMEALRVVELMEKWQPAKSGNQSVHSKVTIPVSFSLSPDEQDFIATLKKYGLDENPPLYIIDDKILHTRVEIPSYNVRSVRVLKGEKAIEMYGEKARNGVVIITSKRGTPPVR